MAQRTVLFDAHRDLGARMVEFAGWDMPVSYSSPFDEHRAVRTRCGLFDVSHMGEIELRGSGAEALCQELTVNDVSRLGTGDGQYSVLCNERGGVVDDLVVFRLDRDRFLLVVNAATTQADIAWIAARMPVDVTLEDRSAELALLALQGPESEHALRTLTPLDLTALRPFTIRETTIAGVRGLVSRTGYTGEDG
ncbi:MAG TPA: glycine cleavage system aminomethyltransferase GcvT, partial [Candidatus Binatia bacterium]|nr:glycine cleavage system aminomethyltransferase GcvT [Candidatus Binatia bacterium]